MDSSSLDSTSSNHLDHGQLPAPTAKDAPSPDSPRLPPGPLVDIQSLTDHALRFLSTASNETLGACLVGLGGVTYLVLGRVGLVLMGVVGGIVLHAQWENNIQELFGDESARAGEEKRRKETSLDIIKRVLDLQAQKQSESARRDDDLDVQLFSGKQLDYSTFQPETAEALDELTDAVIRDYVKWWYSPIVPIELAFPNACRQTLTAFVLSVSNHLSRKRPADFFLEYLTNSSAIIIVFLNELSDAIAASPTTAAPEAIQTYLRSKPDSKLAHVLDRKHQANKLDAVAEDILQNYLEPKTYNCRPARIFLREILAKVILEMTVTNCSKPEWINGWIVYLLEEGEPELMKEIDAGVEGSTGKRLEDVKDQGEDAEGMASDHSPDRARSHRRNVSKAQEAMDEAMKEAKRLTQLIIEEDERKRHGSDEPEKDAGSQGREISRQSHDDTSDGTTQGAATPSSSQSDRDNEERDPSLRDSVMTSRATNNETVKAETANPQPSAEPSRPASRDSKTQAFTSFDQVIGNPNVPTALGGTPQNVAKPPPLTLYNAKVAMFDDSVPGDKSSIRSKPAGDYFIQVEPASTQHPGWMISRKYTDFETLHEVLRRISVVAGVGFNEAHSTLPAWKGHTKPSLRGELERYLNDALCWQPLADSEGIKRFFEKDTGLQAAAGKGFGWPSSAFENVGKGMFDTLTKAPNQVAGGGKALFGGVTGVLGGLGPKKRTTSSTTLSKSDETAQTAAARHKRAESTVSELPNPGHLRSESMISVNQAGRKSTESVRSPLGRRSQESVRNTLVVDQQPAPIPQMERRPSWNPDESEQKTRPGSSSRSSTYGKSSREHSRAPSRAPSGRDSIDISPLMGGDQILNLPPLPSDIPDDYGPPSNPSSPEARRSNTWHQRDDSRRLSRASTVATSLTSDLQSPPKMAPRSNTSKTMPKKGDETKSKTPLNEGETQMAVELFFAIINELYTLSSAWQIRKTLLNAAKTFLLRPGNPQLESIRVLLQDTVLEANSGDSGIASHIKKLRANTLPTEEELKAWPPEMSDEEKEKLRLKARKLLIERGMPQALTSVMGQAATGEALGKVLDCLQVSEVARGFMFGLLLQGVRAVAA